MNTTLFPLIDPERCDGCGYCVTHCHTGALGIVDGKAVMIYPARCDYGAACEDICPTGAIALPYQIVFASSQETPEQALSENEHPE